MSSIRFALPVAAAALLAAVPLFAQTANPQAPADEPAQAAADTARAVEQSTAAARDTVVAPTPEELAARAAATGRPLTIHAPGGTTQVAAPTTTTGAQTQSGVQVVVPATARVNTAPVVAPDTTYTEAYYPDTYYVDSPTVVEYESLIRAGRAPYFSVSTLRAPYYPYYYYRGSYYRPYYSRPYSYYYDRAAAYRFDKHNRPYSSTYDPLGGALHRDAVLHFHRASYPKAHQDVERRSHDSRRFDHDRHRGDRRIDRSHDGRRSETSRPREGYRRESGSDRRGGRDSGARSRDGGGSRSRGTSRSPK